LNLGHHKLLSGFLVLSGGQSIAYALSFSRNIILARLLSKADFGLAATFALAVAMMDLSNRIALGRQVVQAEDGDSVTFLRTAHTFQLLAGIISAGALLLLSVPMSHLFKVPDKAWAFALLALVPAFRALGHLDFQQRQRQLEFLPSVWVELAPQIIVTALAWPLAVWIGDFRVVLILVIGKELLTLIMTHLLAREYYRWGWDRRLAERMWHFGWPLIVNGLLLFVAQQGDQMLVGGGYSLEVLALYSAGATLIAAPFSIMAHAASSVILPVLSRFQRNSSQFNREYHTCVQLSSVAGAATMVPIILVGNQILSTFYGPKYAGGGTILAWLAAGCAFRFLRIAPATAAMARADTQNPMISNLFRISSLFLGAGAVLLGAKVEFIAVSAMCGELVALLASTWCLHYHQAISATETLKSASYLATWLGGAGALAWTGAHEWSFPAALGVSGLLVLLAVATAQWLFPASMGRMWCGVARLFDWRSAFWAQREEAGK